MMCIVQNYLHLQNDVTQQHYVHCKIACSRYKSMCIFEIKSSPLAIYCNVYNTNFPDNVYRQQFLTLTLTYSSILLCS